MPIIFSRPSSPPNFFFTLAGVLVVENIAFFSTFFFFLVSMKGTLQGLSVYIYIFPRFQEGLWGRKICYTHRLPFKILIFLKQFWPLSWKKEEEKDVELRIFDNPAGC